MWCSQATRDYIRVIIGACEVEFCPRSFSASEEQVERVWLWW